MNVLIIINSFRLGGAEKLCYDLARKLCQTKDTNVFLYSIGKIETELEKEMFASFANSPIKVGSFNKPYRKQRIYTALKIKKFCRVYNIDIVHTNGQSPDFLARLAKFFGNKAKIVVTIHNTSGYSKKQEDFFGKFTDAYTAVSEDALQYSKKSLGITNTINLIDNGIDLDLYSDIVKNDQNFEILSVGRVQPQKDYVKAAKFLEPFLKRHKDAKWIIFGDCTQDESYFNEVNQECESLGIRDSVEFKGVVTNPKEIYSHGKVFILASPFEGFGIAFIEAIMSSHHIFSRNVGVIRDIVRNGGVIHDIEDENSMEILEAIFSNTYPNTETKKNKAIVKKLYSLDNMVDKYREVYERVLKNG